MKIQHSTQKSISYLGIYLLLFALLLVQFPLANALTGVTDSWFYVAAFQLYEYYVVSLFSGAPVTEALYPSGPGFMYGDPCFFGALLYRPFCWLGMNELWAWYCMMVVVYATNAFGAYLFFSNWVQKQTTAFWAGLALATSSFCFGNIDSPNAFYLGTMFLCLHCSNNFLNHGQWKTLFLAVVWGASTLYFSAYIFVFQALLLLFFWVYQYPKVLAVEAIVPKLAVAVLVATLLISPYLAFLFSPGGISNAWNPVESFGVIDILSLDLPDLIRPVEGNILYPPLKDGLYDNVFFYGQHAVFPGIALLLLAVVGYRISPLRGRIWLVLAIIGFFMAVGPSVHLAGVRIPMPMALAYDYTPLESAIRNPVRLWYLVLIALIGLSLPAVDKLLQRPQGLLLVVAISAIYVLENAPLQAIKYNATAYAKPDAVYINTLAETPHAVVLELPSAVFTQADWPRGLNEFSREYIYMLWQTKHRQNTVNGCNGFLPYTRLMVDDMICRLVDENILQQLVDRFGINMVVFHKNLPLPVDDKRVEAYLQAHPMLVKLEDTPNTTIYSLKTLP